MLRHTPSIAETLPGRWPKWRRISQVSTILHRGGPPARLLRTPPCNVTEVMRIRATGLYPCTCPWILYPCTCKVQGGHNIYSWTLTSAGTWISVVDATSLASQPPSCEGLACETSRRPPRKSCSTFKWS